MLRKIYLLLGMLLLLATQYFSDRIVSAVEPCAYPVSVIIHSYRSNANAINITTMFCALIAIGIAGSNFIRSNYTVLKLLSCQGKGGISDRINNGKGHFELTFLIQNLGIPLNNVTASLCGNSKGHGLISLPLKRFSGDGDLSKEAEVEGIFPKGGIAEFGLRVPGLNDASKGLIAALGHQSSSNLTLVFFADKYRIKAFAIRKNDWISTLKGAWNRIAFIAKYHFVRNVTISGEEFVTGLNLPTFCDVSAEINEFARWIEKHSDLR